MTAFEPGSLLRRYQAGEHEAVWADMVALGAAVRQAPYADDAWAVARETMRRARHNIELIIRRLDQLGYRFWDGTTGSTGALAMVVHGEAVPMADLTSERLVDHVMKQFQLPEQMQRNVDKRLRESLSRAEPLFQLMRGHAADHAAAEQVKAAEAARRAAITDHLSAPHVFAPATEEDAAFYAEMEEKGMLLPLSLRAWFEEVGDVNLIGSHPALAPRGIASDPLTIFSDSLMNEIDTWREYNEAGEDTDSHEIVLSWDAEDKAKLLADKTELYDYGYVIDIPNAAADAVLECEAHKTTFINYLRIAFRWGGFPGWEQQQSRPEKELRLLTDGLLPI